MPTIRIGFRRLFEAVECSVVDEHEIRVEKKLPNNLNLCLYIGPTPIFGTMVSTGRAKYMTRNPARWQMAPYEPLSNPPKGFYTEIICTEELEITEDEFSKIEKGDVQLKEKYQKQAETNGEKFKHVVNWYAGVLGLRIHRLFVVEPIIENFFVSRDDLSNLNMPLYGPALENIKIISINKTGIDQFKDFPSIFPIKTEDVPKFGTAFEWLLRAWHVRHGIERFIALFIPMEIILNSINATFSPSNQEIIEKLTAANLDSSLIQSISERLQHAKPSLVNRFEFMASSFKLDGWEQDVEAFKKFNRMRNDLLHGRRTNVTESVAIATKSSSLKESPGDQIETEVAMLEDIVERYLCRSIFGDSNLYLSFWREHKATRPKPSETINP